jgi:hypothetical protein
LIRSGHRLPGSEVPSEVVSNSASGSAGGSASRSRESGQDSFKKQNNGAGQIKGWGKLLRDGLLRRRRFGLGAG